MQRHRLADAHLAQLHFLEVRLHPHLVERNDRHQRRAGLDALAQLHRALGDLTGHRRGQLGALQRQERLAHRGCSALHVRMVLDAGAFGQRLVRGGLLARGGQRRLGAGQRAARGRQRGLGVLHLFAGHRAGGHQRHAAVHGLERAGHVGLRARHLGLAQVDVGRQRAVGRIHLAHLAHRLRELRLRALERDLRIGGVEPDERLAGLHDVGVVGQDLQHGAAHLRRDLHDRRLHVGVVGAFVVAQHERPVRAVGEPGDEREAGHREQRGLALAGGDGGRGGGGRGRGGGRGLGVGVVRIAHGVLVFDSLFSGMRRCRRLGPARERRATRPASRRRARAPAWPRR